MTLPNVPSRQGITDVNTKRALDALAEGYEVLAGKRGDPEDHALRKSDLPKEKKTEKAVETSNEKINIVRSFAGAGRTIPVGFDTTELIRATVTTTGQPVAVFVSMVTRILITGLAGLSGTLQVQVLRDEQVIWQPRLVVEFQSNGIYAAANSQMCNISTSDNPSEGQHTYQFLADATAQPGATATFQVSNISLVLICGITEIDRAA